MKIIKKDNTKIRILNFTAFFIIVFVNVFSGHNFVNVSWVYVKYFIIQNF